MRMYGNIGRINKCVVDEKEGTKPVRVLVPYEISLGIKLFSM